MKAAIQRINPEPGQRILAVSDIHGNGIYLEKLLKQACFAPEDILIIVGDMIDKGMNSLKTLRYIMELSQNPNVYVTMGNVELGRITAFDDDTEEGLTNFVHLIHYMKQHWGGGLFEDMLQEIGVNTDLLTLKNVKIHKKKIIQKFSSELDFIRKLPAILEMGAYIFVHGGIPDDHLEQLDLSDARIYLKNDHFLEKNYSFSKYVVVGHWPVSLYELDGGNSPVIDYNKHIISIDGGNALKKEGQLNLLIIPDIYGSPHEITWIYEDGCPKAKILEPQSGRKAQVNIKWGDNKVVILEEHGDTALVKHETSGQVLMIAKSYLWNDNFCEDTSDAQIEVFQGDIVSVIEITQKGAIVKKDGWTGWYFGKLELQ